MAIDADTLEKLWAEPEIPPLDLSWLNLDNALGVMHLKYVRDGRHGCAPPGWHPRVG